MCDKNKLINLNTLKITFPYSYAINQARLNWHDIMIAINNELLPLDAAIDYAQDELEKKEESSQNIIELAIIPRSPIFSHSIHPYIDELAKVVDIKEKEKTKSKLMFILLKWVYENMSLYENPLLVVDFIYDDFGFPKSIEELIYYLPANSAENNIYEKWHDFLSKEEQKWRY